jgi:hypothetical protein
MSRSSKSRLFISVDRDSPFFPPRSGRRQPRETLVPLTSQPKEDCKQGIGQERVVNDSVRILGGVRGGTCRRQSDWGSGSCNVSRSVSGPAPFHRWG